MAITKYRDIYKSKFIVIVAIALFWMCGSLAMQANAKGIDGYRFSTVFQYYMLDNQADNITKDNKKQKIASMGNFGSGGASGTFSYDDIVNSVNDDANKKDARKFASMMATYATFRYITNQVQGFEATFQSIGRFATMIILVPLGVITDTLHLIEPLIVSLIAKLNIITALGDVYMSSDLGKSTAKSLGISIPALKEFMDAALTFAISGIIISVVLTIRKGTIDSRHVGKLKGRLMSLFALGIIVSGGAHLIEDASKLAAQAPIFNTGFNKYLIDDRSWAFNYNFTPSGNDTSQESDIKPNSKSGSYVDLSFNPYTNKGVKRIDAINRDSSLAGNGALFPNSALAYSYGMNESFSAVDFIDYKGTAESESIYGTNKKLNDGQLSGSYYKYANDGAKNGNLMNTDKVFTGSLNHPQTGYVNGGPFVAAKDDYIKDKKLIVSPQTAWRDRFIYGAKRAGKNIDKYYNESPSWEQLITTVGESAHKNALTDSSMYLVLSSIFTETGGRYYISAPARGAFGKIASFDSNRSTYSVVSMVGSPIFTIPGMVAGTIIQIVVLLMMLAAIESVGLLEMNVKPATAFLQGLFIGDIEYSYAFIIYSIGVCGTILCLVGIPSMIVAMFTTAGTLIQPNLGRDTSATPQASLVLSGMTLIFECLVGLGMGVLFFKSKKFRRAITSALVMPWTWALTMGDRIQRQVNPYGMQMKSRIQDKLNKNKVLSAMDMANEQGVGARQMLGDMGRELFDQLTPKRPKPGRNTDDNPDNFNDDGERNAESYDELMRQKSINQVNDSLQELDDGQADGHKLSRLSFVQSKLNDFKRVPSKENLMESEKQLSDFRDYLVDNDADQDDIATVDQAMDDLHALDDRYGIKGYQPKNARTDNDVIEDDNTADENKDDNRPVNSKEKDTRSLTPEQIKQRNIDDFEDVDGKSVSVNKEVNTDLKNGETTSEELEDEAPKLHPADSKQAVNRKLTASHSDVENVEELDKEAPKLHAVDSKQEVNKTLTTGQLNTEKNSDVEQESHLMDSKESVAEKGKGTESTSQGKHSNNNDSDARPLDSKKASKGAHTVPEMNSRGEINMKSVGTKQNDKKGNILHQTTNSQRQSIDKRSVDELKQNRESRALNNSRQTQTNSSNTSNDRSRQPKYAKGGQIVNNVQNHNHNRTATQINRNSTRQLGNRTVNNSQQTNRRLQTNNVEKHRNIRNVNNSQNSRFSSMNSNSYNQRQIRNQKIQRINSLRHAMGPARHDENIRRAIRTLGNSHNQKEFNRGVGQLKHAMNHLTPQMRTQINRKNTTQLLHSMVNSIRQ